MLFDLEIIKLALLDAKKGASDAPARFDEAGVLLDQAFVGIVQHLQSGRTAQAKELIPVYKAALSRLLVVNASLGVAHGIMQGDKYTQKIPVDESLLEPDPHVK